MTVNMHGTEWIHAYPWQVPGPSSFSSNWDVSACDLPCYISSALICPELPCTAFFPSFPWSLTKIVNEVAEHVGLLHYPLKVMSWHRTKESHWWSNGLQSGFLLKPLFLFLLCGCISVVACSKTELKHCCDLSSIQTPEKQCWTEKNHNCLCLTRNQTRWLWTVTRFLILIYPIRLVSVVRIKYEDPKLLAVRVEQKLIII